MTDTEPVPVTLGQTAYEAYAARVTDLRALYAGTDFPSAAPQPWDRLPDTFREGWEAGAGAVWDRARADLIAEAREAGQDFADEPDGDSQGDPHARIAELEHQLATATSLVRQLERIAATWTRGMYAAQIDCLRGDAASAIRILSEGLDGYEGELWNGTETGTEWWERTKAEEGVVTAETAPEEVPDPFGGHEFHYESSTDLFRCIRCHVYEVTARKGDGPGEFEPCTGEHPAGSQIEVNAW